MKIGIAGGNGFIGKNVASYLRGKGAEVSIIVRGDLENGGLKEKIRDCDVLVNLMGEPVNGFWTRGKRKKIYESRVLTTRRLIDFIEEFGRNITTFVQISGVGIYDNKHIHNEESKFTAYDFLSGVIVDWEKETRRLSVGGRRIVIMRMGIVLGNNGGILKTLLGPFRNGVGFTIKCDENFPFIHIKDVCGIVGLILDNTDIEGIINVVSPKQVTIHDFFSTLALYCHTRIIIPVAPAILHCILGESSVMLTHGQNVLPERLIGWGYSFQYGSLAQALTSILEPD